MPATSAPTYFHTLKPGASKPGAKLPGGAQCARWVLARPVRENKGVSRRADTAYAIWRACYVGYETWLNTVNRGRTYRAGDAWGCIGRRFAGRWHTPPAEKYIANVRRYLREKIRKTPNFQQP